MRFGGGPDKDGLCAVSLEDLQSANEMQNLERRLETFIEEGDIQKFMAEEWDKGSFQRSDILAGLVTAVVTILVAIWSVFNRELQQVEALLLSWTTNFTSFVQKTIGLPLLKTGIRAAVLLGVIVFNLFNVFRSLMAVKTEPTLATSEALLQELNGTRFVTSTYQIIPQWTIFYVVGSVLLFLFVAVVFGVYARMRYLEEAEAKEAKLAVTRDINALAEELNQLLERQKLQTPTEGP